MTLGRRGELVRRMRYARAELTPGLERRQARRAEFEARYGPCTGEPGGWCPRCGQHEPDPATEPEPLATPLDSVVFVGPLVVMLGVAAAAIVWDWPLWLGVLGIVLAGPVLDRVLYRVRDRTLDR